MRACRFVERVEQRVFGLFGGGSQLVEGEDLAEDRAETQQLVAFLADAIETMADRFFHALRDDELIHVTTLPSPAFTAHGTAFDQRLQNFLDEKRIAFSFAMHGDGKLAADVFTEQRAELVACFVGVEATQDDARDETFAVPVDQGFCEWMGAIEFCLSIRADDQYALIAELAQQVAHEPERAAIGPVQIVCVEEQRLSFRDVREDLGDGVEE